MNKIEKIEDAEDTDSGRFLVMEIYILLKLNLNKF